MYVYIRGDRFETEEENSKSRLLSYVSSHRTQKRASRRGAFEANVVRRMETEREREREGEEGWKHLARTRSVARPFVATIALIKRDIKTTKLLSATDRFPSVLIMYR